MISYKQWKANNDLIVSEDNHIGKEIVFFESGEQEVANWGPYRADMVIAIIIYEGEMDMTIDMRQYKVAGNSLITILPNQIFQTRLVSEHIRGCTVLMSWDFAVSLFNRYAKFGHLYRATARRPVMALDERLAKAFGLYIELLRNLARSPQSAYKLEAARHLTLALFYGIISETEQLSQPQPIDRQVMLFQQFEKELRHNYKREREVQWYADKLCVSAKYLSAVVLEQTGMPALRFINKQVMNECQAMLLSTDLSLQQISDSLNFPSPSVFSKFFKRMSGMSPRQYRKQTAGTPQ